MDLKGVDMFERNLNFDTSRCAITRMRNRFTDEIEWCVGRVDLQGNINPIAFGKTIEEAINNTDKMIDGHNQE